MSPPSLAGLVRRPGSREVDPVPLQPLDELVRAAQGRKMAGVNFVGVICSRARTTRRMKVAGKSGDHLRRNVVEEAGHHIERAVGGPAVALVLLAHGLRMPSCRPASNACWAGRRAPFGTSRATTRRASSERQIGHGARLNDGDAVALI